MRACSDEFQFVDQNAAYAPPESGVNVIGQSMPGSVADWNRPIREPDMSMLQRMEKPVENEPVYVVSELTLHSTPGTSAAPGSTRASCTANTPTAISSSTGRATRPRRAT